VPFLGGAGWRDGGGLGCWVAVPGATEGGRLLGFAFARHGVQPVWVQVDNGSNVPWVLLKRTIDPSYYSPAEAARVTRYRTATLSSLILLPLLPVSLVQEWQARAANARLAERFEELRFTPDVIPPGEPASGLVSATHDRGTKRVEVALFGPDEPRRFEFFIAVPGSRLDHEQLDVAGLYPDDALVTCN